MRNLLLLPALSALLFFSFGKGLMAFGPAHVSDLQTNGPVVVELYTSQSCSSCPPADRVLAQIADHPDVIALGFHVTYWDHLHWKDTLSQPFATSRQRAFNAQRGTGRIYTPQMVVNGSAEFVGSNGARLEREAAKAAPLKKISLERKADELVAHLPNFDNDQPLTLWVFGVKDTHTQAIPRGENRGREVTYRHSVLSQAKLAPWNGSAQSREIAIPENADHLVIIAQDRDFGVVRAAGKLKL